LATIDHPESRPAEGAQGSWAGVGEGLSAVLGHSLLRALTLASSTLNFFLNLLLAVLVLYLSRDLALDAATIGVVFASVGIGGLCGAVVARAVVRRIGLGTSLVAASLIAGSGGLFVPLAGGVPVGIALPVLLTGALLFGGGLLIWNVNVVSLRQAITPDRLQGRVNATARFLIWGSMPVGALLGGVLGERLGLRPTISIAALGMLVPCLWVICSPARTLHDHPRPSWTQAGV
jgi:predicted MFS family arabinose efflux permease